MPRIFCLEQNIGRMTSDKSYYNAFWDMTPKAKEIKAKTNKQGLIKLKNI